MSAASSQERMTMNIAPSGLDRDVSARDAVVLRAGLRKRYIQDTLVRMNGKMSSASDADWVSSLENNSSFPPRYGSLAENSQPTISNRRIKWTLPDGAVEFVVERKNHRNKHNRSRRRRIRRLTEQEKQQLYEQRPDLRPEKGNTHADVDLEVRHGDNAIVSFTDAMTKHAVMFSPRALGNFFGSAITHIQDYAYGSSDDDDSSDSDTSSDSDSERSESSYSDQSEEDFRSTQSLKGNTAKKSLSKGSKQQSSVSDLMLDAAPRNGQHYLPNESPPSPKLHHSSKPSSSESRASPINDKIISHTEGGSQYSQQESAASNRWALRPDSGDSIHTNEKALRRRGKGVALGDIDVDSVLDDLSRQSQEYYLSTGLNNIQESSTPRKRRDKSARKNRKHGQRRAFSIGEMVTKFVSERESTKGSSAAALEDADVQRESAEVLMDLVASETFVGTSAADTTVTAKEIVATFPESSWKVRRGGQRRSGGRRVPPLTEYFKAMVSTNDVSGTMKLIEEQKMTNAEILDSLEKALDHTATPTLKPPTPRRGKKEGGTPTNRLHVVTTAEFSPSNDGTFLDNSTTAGGLFSSVPELSAEQHFQKEIPPASDFSAGPFSPSYQLDLLAMDYKKMDLSSDDPSYRRFVQEFFGDNDENNQQSSSSSTPVSEAITKHVVVPEPSRLPLEVRRPKAADDFKKKLMSNRVFQFNTSNNS